MRLIDAEALKRRAQKVATESWKMRLTANVETVLNQFIDWIDQADTAEPERHGLWIPCSERLPEIIKGHYVSDVCIVYCDTGAYGFTILEENIFCQVGWQCERDDDYHEPLGEVIAWMPLPEPYREGEQK